MKEKPKDVKVRSWCFTYFPTLDTSREVKWFEDLSMSHQIRYILIGIETCPTSGRKHFQGYISFNNGKSFKQTKKWFGIDKIHLEEAHGNDMQNLAYCSKENLWIEKGVPLKQGSRTDIQRAIDILDKTSSVAAVLDEVHNYQAVKHAQLYIKFKEKKRPIKPIEVIWIYGVTGAGKTLKVYTDNSGCDIFTPTTFKWWDTYDGHKIVLIDDIRRSWCKFHELLRLLDIYPFRVETKGGTRQIQFTKIYITAPISPLEMWSSYCEVEDEDVIQLLRRITQTINIDKI